LQRIKEIIYDRKQVDVLTLSEILDVSDVTIRSDLEQLEQSGFIIRMHGGAVLNESSTRQTAVNEALSCQTIEYNKNKEEIGKIAASLIAEREWVFLGPGTTCYYIAKELLHRKSINILTNNFYVVNVLFANPSINVIVAGGQMNHETGSTYGDIFTRSIESIFFSKAFFSVGGADMSAGYTVSSAGEMELLRAVSQKTQELIFTIDHTKYDAISFMQIGNLDTAKTVISNDKMPNAYKKYYFENGIRVFTSYDLVPLAF
ncbi:MAG: DeoR/GlpR family DNA-binding transcription regulator, partial [Eubacteriales bacterium]